MGISLVLNVLSLVVIVLMALGCVTTLCAIVWILYCEIRDRAGDDDE